MHQTDLTGSLVVSGIHRGRYCPIWDVSS